MNFRFVIIGTGGMAESYSRALKKVPGAELAGVVSRTGKHPAWLAPELPTATTLDTFPEPFDAVIVATPNGTHGDWIARAALLKKAVFCEKVLEISAARAAAAAEACRQHDVTLAVCFQHRIHPDNMICYQMIQDGTLGKIYCAEVRVPYFRDQKYYDSADYRGTLAVDGGGPLIQQAAHQLDLYYWFFGMPSEISCMLARHCHEMEGEDFGAALLRHPDGMIGTLLCTTDFKPGFDAEISIHCERGFLKLVNGQFVDWQIEGLDCPGAGREALSHHSGASAAKVADTGDHERMLEDFIDAVQTHRKPLVSGDDAVATAKFIEALYRSASAPWK